MAKCDVCGNNYDKSFTVTMSGETQQFLNHTGRPVMMKPLTIDRVRAVVDEVLAVTE